MFSQFSAITNAYWHDLFLSGEPIYQNAQLTVVSSTALQPDRRLMLLQSVAGQLWAVMAPDIARRLDLPASAQEQLSATALRQRIQDANIRLYDADQLFYFNITAQQTLLQQVPLPHFRQLHATDAAMFAEFQSRVSAEDLDDAYVELDHWAVFGAFVEGQLVSAASMYPWDAQKIADTGVLTLADYRGAGHARHVIRAISRYATELGYQPQYRCQTDNIASTRVARAAGMELFGHWQVIAE